MSTVLPTAPSRRVTIAWAVAGLAAAAWYFSWLLAPGRAGVAWLFGALVIADLFNGFHATSFWLTCLRDGARRKVPRLLAAPTERPRVDVLIPTYNEPLEILEATVLGARRMRGADLRVWLLDDGDRPEVAELALLHDVRYLTRPDRSGAKAGNLNHAMAILAAEAWGELVAVFDADHVPRPQFLERTLRHLADPDVALVQTPQVYANTDAGILTRASAEQQAIFFGPICRGRDGWDGAFCCGTNFLARLDDLLAVGGFPEDSVTEDIVLSIALVGAGKRIAYEGEPLADGLGPEDARSYLKQQFRWAAGCLDLLLRRPDTLRPLSWKQRWQYVVATSYWLTGWTVLVYLSLPVARLAFDAPVLQDPGSEFAVHYLPYFVLAVVSLGRFTHGEYTVRGLVLNWGCFFVHVRATIAVLLNRPGGFAVTSKTALAGVPWRLLIPNVLAVAILLGAAGFALVDSGLSAATLGDVSFALLAAALVGPIAGFAVMQSRQTARRVQRQRRPPLVAPAARTGRFDRVPAPGPDRVPDPVPTVGGAR